MAVSTWSTLILSILLILSALGVNFKLVHIEETEDKSTVLGRMTKVVVAWLAITFVFHLFKLESAVQFMLSPFMTFLS